MREKVIIVKIKKMDMPALIEVLDATDDLDDDEVAVIDGSMRRLLVESINDIRWLED